MLHPQLLPSLIIALIGFVLICAATYLLARRWKTLSRRLRWLYGGALALVEIIFWLGVYAFFIEPRTLVVREVSIERAHWQGAPLRIAVMSDTHVGGPHVDARRVERLVARINEAHPDLVVLLGDYVGGHKTDAERSVDENIEINEGLVAFARLEARYGVIAVIGNHDVWYNRESVVDALQGAGVAVLANRNVTISRAGGDFVVAGLEDETTEHPDVAAALDGAEPIDTILLSHSPDVFPDAPARVGLTLAAHSHCGQVTIPFVGRPIVPIRRKQYACHLVEENGRVMYVTGGVGTSIAPLRFLNPPEIVLVTLSGAHTQTTR